MFYFSIFVFSPSVYYTNDRTRNQNATFQLKLQRIIFFCVINTLHSERYLQLHRKWFSLISILFRRTTVKFFFLRYSLYAFHLSFFFVDSYHNCILCDKYPVYKQQHCSIIQTENEYYEKYDTQCDTNVMNSP